MDVLYYIWLNGYKTNTELHLPIQDIEECLYKHLNILNKTYTHYIKGSYKDSDLGDFYSYDESIYKVLDDYCDLYGAEYLIIHNKHCKPFFKTIWSSIRREYEYRREI